MTRRYVQDARAIASAERRERILRATVELLRQHRYDDISLEGIAARAGVGLVTLTRHFPSKGVLLVEATRWWTSHEEARREVVPSDVLGVVAVLASRYEDGGLQHHVGSRRGHRCLVGW